MVVQVIPLIAGLRDENKNLSDVYFAEGLSSEGDSGSGHYYWNETSTLADDGFNVLQVTGVPTGRWIRIYAGYNIYSADGSLAGDRTVTLNGHYLAFAGASYSSTFNADGSVTLGSLVGSGTRMVVAGPSGVLGTQAIAPGTGTTTRFIETFTATAGQTTFITANTLLNDFFDVFVNGVRLDSLSYTNTSNQVVLTDGCLVGDIVDIVGFSSLGVATTLPSQSGNAGKYLRTDGANVYWDTVSSANNIYNANGTLTGNRVMTMAGYTLSFNGGNVSIGNTAPLSALHVGDRNVNNSTNPVILISRNVTSSFASNTHAFSDSSLLQLATGLAYNSYDARVDIGGSNSIDHYAGFQHGINVNTSGTIMNIYGLFTNTTITAGAIENNYSVYAYNPTGAGTITNNFGLYVANLSKGSNNYGVYLDISSGSGKWNIYSNGTADSYINGNVGIGAVPGAYKLDVTGTFRTSGVNTLSNLSGTGTRMVVADATGILSTQSVPSLTGYVPYTGATQNVDLGIYKLTTDAIQFSLTPTNSPAAGQIAYYGATGALAYLMDATSVMCQIGQQLYAYVTNDETITILKGQPVYLFSATGNRASVKLAANTSDATSAKTLGLAAQDITAGQKGFIMCQGTLDGLDTGSYLSGATLYLGATAGTLTSTKPYAPNHLVYIGVVERSNAGNGQIYVRPQNGYELDEIHDVDLISTPPVNNDILTYVTGTNNLWKPRSIASILGYTPQAQLTLTTTGTTGAATLVGATLNIPQYQGALTLTTTGTSGAATLVGNTLNIPQYSGGGGGMAIGGSITSATAGSVLFAGTSGVLAQDNSNLFWDNTNKRLGIGTATPNSQLQINANIAGTAQVKNLSINDITTTTYSNLAFFNVSQSTTRGSFILSNNSSGDWANNFLMIAVTGASHAGNNYFNNISGKSSDAGYGMLLSQGNQTTGIILGTINNSPIHFGTNNLQRLSITNGGNILVNTSTDSGYRFDINGTSRHNGKTTLTGSVTASASLAQGIIATPTLIAAANNDVLVGLDVAPTFTNGAFTGVSNYVARFGNHVGITTSNAFSLNYITFNALTSNQGISAELIPDGTPTSVAYNFQFSKSKTANNNALLIIGGGISSGSNISNKHVITTSADGTATGQPLVLRVAATGVNWNSVNDHFTLFSSGNLALQNSATTATDSGERLQVTGTAKITGSTQITGSTTAATAIARGAYLNPTLVAAANNDVLVGLDVDPTFTNGAFTGVSNISLRIQGGIVTNATSTQDNGVTIRGTTGVNSGNCGFRLTTAGTATDYSIFSAPNLSGLSVGGIGIYDIKNAKTVFGFQANAPNNALFMFSTGNILIAGSSLTDSGEKLQVTGTAKITSTLSLTSMTTGSVPFIGASGAVSQDNSNLFWDNTNKRLGIGTTTPNSLLSIVKNQNNTTGIEINNNTNGTSSVSVLILNSDTNSGTSSFGKYSSSASYKMLSSRDAYIYNVTGGDISIFNDLATGKIKFGTGGVSTAQATLFSTGNFVINSTTDSGERLQVTGTAKITSTLSLTSMTTGSVHFTGASGAVSEDSANLFWDNTNKRLGIGTSSPNAALHVSGSTTASGAIARGTNFTPTLVAAANNDVLVGLDVNPTFTNGAFTGVTNYGIRVSPQILINGFSSSDPSLILNALSTSTSKSSVLLFNVNNSNKFVFGYTESASTPRFFIYNSNTDKDSIKIYNATSNVVIGNNPGSNTDAGYRLDVNGTTRLQGTTYVSTGNFLLGSATDSGERLQVTGTAKITSKLSMGAGTTSAAQINLASSTAPTSPANGDIWNDGSDLYMRIGGVTKKFTLV